MKEKQKLVGIASIIGGDGMQWKRETSSRPQWSPTGPTEGGGQTLAPSTAELDLHFPNAFVVKLLFIEVR